MFQTGILRISMPSDEFEGGATRTTRPLARGCIAPNPRAISLLPAGSAVAQGIVARMGGDCPAGSSQTTRARSRLCRDVL